MKKNNPIRFVSLLKDEEFLNLVRRQKDTDTEIRDYILAHKQDEEVIRHAIAFVRLNLEQQKKLGANEVKRIWTNIELHFERMDRKRRFRARVIRYSKVAAVLLALATISSLVYKYYSREDLLDQMARNEVEAGSETVIILSDGSSHHLNSKDEHIQYSKDGSEILVKDASSEAKTLKNEQKEDEKPVVNQIIVPYGRRHVITLSDGTEVHLNSGSTLIYPAEFNSHTRKVFLRGEGYFNVKHDPAKPFIVKTDNLDLKVLGTSFNVSAYQDEKMVSAVLVEGKVTVQHKNELLGYTKKELTPGQALFYSVAQAKAEIRNVDVQDYISWKDGILRFKDQTLQFVVNRLQKYYNLAISVESEQLKNTLISGKLVLFDDAGKVVDLLSKTLEVRYEKKDSQTYLLTE